jgi:hypothetical protein
MAEKDSQTKSALKGAFWGGVVGGGSSALAIGYLDEFMAFASKSAQTKFDSSTIKVVLATTVVGAAIGAFASAKSAKANYTPWTERVDDQRTEVSATPLTR